MQNIKLGLFDILGYILPGAVGVLGTFILFDHSIESIYLIPRDLRELSTALAIIFIIAAYILGFALNDIGDRIFQVVNRRFGYRYSQILNAYFNTKFSKTRYLALIRHFSPGNFLVLDEWLAKRALSHNLSFVCLLFMLTGIFKAIMFPQYAYSWLALGGLMLTLSIILLIRSQEYNRLYLQDMYSTIEELNLREKAIKENCHELNIPDRLKKLVEESNHV